jgi:hypothetical protein
MQTLRKDGTIYIEQLPLVMQNSAFYIKKLCNFSQIIIIIILFLSCMGWPRLPECIGLANANPTQLFVF